MLLTSNSLQYLLLWSTGITGGRDEACCPHVSYQVL